MINKADIKAATRHLISHLDGVRAAAALLNVTKGEVSYWCSDNHDRFIPIDHLAEADERGGDVFLKEWARSRGYDLVRRHADVGDTTNVLKIVGRFSKDAGELDSVILDAVADNILTAAEKRLIRDNIAPVKDDISALERAIGA